MQKTLSDLWGFGDFKWLFESMKSTKIQRKTWEEKRLNKGRKRKDKHRRELIIRLNPIRYMCRSRIRKWRRSGPIFSIRHRLISWMKQELGRSIRTENNLYRIQKIYRINRNEYGLALAHQHAKYICSIQWIRFSRMSVWE